jgi:hypothetical protein
VLIILLHHFSLGFVVMDVAELSQTFGSVPLVPKTALALFITEVV